jgi:pyrroloquinoline quinone biosynthesis protein B
MNFELKNVFFYQAVVLIIAGGSCKTGEKAVVVNKEKLPEQFIVVLGIAQDAGYPQTGCDKECCAAYWKGKEKKKHVTSLALFDTQARQYFLFEATPDITEQLQMVQPYLGRDNWYPPDGIFLTHAHIGHYAGLMQLGREAMGARSVPVWAMPRMKTYLESNGPWNQLVSLKNIQLRPLREDSTVQLNAALKVTPIRVPHRDEFSETVGFIIQSPQKKVLFIPDIDKWEKWGHSIAYEIKKADVALIDGTFYNGNELPGRDMKEIPHPFVQESMEFFSGLPLAEKEKIIFIHFNHTNPLLKSKSAEKQAVAGQGYKVAAEGMMIKM